jgi:predicted DNA-binding transcriptional regulator AlpA
MSALKQLSFKATLNKTEVMKYLSIGEVKLKKLLTNPTFPKPKPVIEKWSKDEVDKWLGNSDMQTQSVKEQNWREFI